MGGEPYTISGEEEEGQSNDADLGQTLASERI